MRVLGWTGENRRCCRFYRLATLWVVLWGAGGVDDCGWDEFDVAVVDKDFPTSSMHVTVVSFTQKHAV